MIDPQKKAGEPSAADCAPLASVLCTKELDRRPIRVPDYERQSHAFLKLTQAFAESPDDVFESLTQEILTLLHCHSAGISLLSDDATRFDSVAVAGAWRQHAGGGTPRDFGPSGDAIDCNAPLLFRHPERRYAYLLSTPPPAVELLVVPFHLLGRAVGTIWAVSHDEHCTFDAEDLRQLQSLSTFATAAYRAHGVSAQEKTRDSDALRLNTALATLNAELRDSATAVRRSDRSPKESRRAERG